MVRTLMGQEIIEEIRDNAIIGYENKVANPNFLVNTNHWTATSATVAPKITSSGIQLVGSGQFYQNLNTDDVANGDLCMARVYVNTISGTWNMLGATAGSGVKASGAYSVVLAAGWNSVRFTAGASHRLNLTSTDEAGTDTLICSPVEIRQQVDVTVTGQIRNFEAEFSGGTIDGTLTVTSLLTASAGIATASIAMSGALTGVTTINPFSTGSITASTATIGELTVSGIAITASNLEVGSMLASTLVTGDLIASTVTGNTSFSSGLTAVGTLSTNDAILSVAKTLSGTFQAIGTLYNGSMSSGDSILLNIGKSASASQMAWMMYGYNTTPADTFIGFGHSGTVELVKFYQDGRVLFGGTATIAGTVVISGLPTSSGAAASNGLFRDGTGTSILYVKAT